MTIISIQPTYPIFGELDGTPLETGFIYIGTAGLNPITNAATVYWDYALSIPATQPIRTIGGRPVRNGTAARIYFEGDYSMAVTDRNGNLVYSELNHPAQSALDSIVGLTTVAGTDAITAVAPAPPTAYAATQRWSFIAAATNTSAVTINISGLGVRSITKNGAVALDPGDIPINAVIQLEDDGTQLQLINVQNMASQSGATFTGLVNLATGADIASATTVDLTAATGNLVHITGTTTTTGFTMNSGQRMELISDAAWPLTYHATTMNLNGGIDQICAAGDRLFVFYDGTITYVNIEKQSGAAINCFVGLIANKTGASTIGTGANVAIALDTAALDTSEGKLTISAGNIVIGAGVTRVRVWGSNWFASHATGYRQAHVKHGAAILTQTVNATNALSGVVTPHISGSTVIDVVATDTITLEVFQNSGGDLNTVASSSYLHVEVVK